MLHMHTLLPAQLLRSAASPAAAQVNTKVDMRLRLDAAAWLDDEIREAVKRAVSGWRLRGWAVAASGWGSFRKVALLPAADPRPHCAGGYHASVAVQEKKRINKEGELVITSQRTRSQA